MLSAALRGEMNISKLEGWADVEGRIDFPIRFDAPDLSLFFPKELLARTLPGADPLNHRHENGGEVPRENDPSDPSLADRIHLPQGHRVTMRMFRQIAVSKRCDSIGHRGRMVRPAAED